MAARVRMTATRCVEYVATVHIPNGPTFEVKLNCLGSTVTQREQDARRQAAAIKRAVAVTIACPEVKRGATSVRGVQAASGGEGTATGSGV